MYEAIIRKELCKRDEPSVELEESAEVIKVKPKVELAKVSELVAKETFEEPSETLSERFAPEIKSVSLHIKLPKGKFSDFYRGVLSILEDNFVETEVFIKIKAKKR